MPFWFAVVLAASGVSGAFAPFRGCSYDNIGGRGRLRRPELVLQKAQTSVVIGGVVDTGEQFIAGVVDTLSLIHFYFHPKPLHHFMPLSYHQHGSESKG